MSLIVLVFLSFTANAFIVPGDNDYNIYKSNSTSIIFADEHKDFIPELVKFNNKLNSILSKTYKWEIDNHSHFVLTSSRNQTSNAFATVTPFVLSTYYHSGAALLEKFAESNWLLHTWTHELSHMYQLNSKSRFSSLLYSFLGSPPSFYSIIVHPNQLAPRHFTEGNAVLVESLFNSGGRLHSGEIRAEVYALFKSNIVDTAWLLNNFYEFPYGAEKYHVGGYFQMYLAEKYGLIKTNSYFYAQAQKWYWPFIINSTYKEHFFKSYYDLFYKFKYDITKKAELQKQVPRSQQLAKSKKTIVLNRDKNKIYALTTDLQTKPKLKIYDIKKRSFLSKPTKLSFNSRGKVFNINNKWYSQATSIIETDRGVSIIQGLYDASMNLKPDSFGEYVLDIQGNKKLSYKIQPSMVEPHLYLNEKFYDIAHSKALFDESGNIYYFKQKGRQRTLYKNKKPVFSFSGFYSKLADIKNDTVYFIANTDYGSTIYKFSNNTIVRVCTYDNIVDAKLIDENHALVSAIYGEGYYLSKVKINNALKQTPVLYNYEVENLNTKIELDTTNNSPKISSEKYSAFKNLKFSYFLPRFSQINTTSSSGQVKNHTVFSIDLGFSDPLGWNQLNLYYFRDTFEDDTFNFMYQYSKYRLQFGFGYDYSKDSIANSDNKVITTFNTNIFDVFLKYPYYISPRWQHLSQLTHSLETASNNTESYYTTALLSGGYTYSAGSLGLQPYTGFQYQLGYRIYEDHSNIYRSDLNFSQNIGYELYPSVNLNYAKATKNNLLKFYSSQLKQAELDEIQSYSLDTLSTYSEVFKANLELKKGFITELYTDVIPLGLTRLSPLAGVSHFSFSYLDSNKALRPYSHVTESYYGVEVEVLIAHALPIKIQLIEAQADLGDQSKNLFFNINTRYDF